MTDADSSAIATQTASADTDLLLLVDWLPPDFGAIGQYALQFAEARASAGARVCVVGFSTLCTSTEQRSVGAGHLRIVRLNRRHYDKQNLLARAWWTIGANVRLLVGARQPLRHAREVIFTGSPPFLLHFIAPLKPLLKGHLRYRIADFHPECLIAARGKRSVMLALLEQLTWFWRRRMDTLEIVSEDQRLRLLAHGVSAARVELRRDRSPITFDGVAAQPVPAPLHGKRVILYSGNWGVAHDSDTFLAGLALLNDRERSEIAVWLNATGARVAQVSAGVSALGISVHHSPPCSLEQLAGILLAADLHLITLANAFVGLVLPSKVYACLDSKRPILFIGDTSSDVHALAHAKANESGYWQANIGDASAVCAALQSLLSKAP